MWEEKTKEVTYRDFAEKGIDLAPLGIIMGSGDETYFCTPKGAEIFGWAGVDGIHYCLIPGFGEMVFAISPMNLLPHCVHPLARTFSDFLRLLLACGNCDALEQAWQWDEAEFQGFLAENPPTQEQQEVLEQLVRQTSLTPMEHPWQYLRELQTGFAYDKIKYTEDYYDLVRNLDAPQPPQKWKVFFDGGFWGSGRGRPGKEVAIHKEFDWAGHHWVIPAVYFCGKGMVVDFCMRIEPAAIHTFLKKWDISPENEAELHFTRAQRMELDLENPMRAEFNSVLCLNGRELYSTCGYGTSYNPCLGPEHAVKDEAKQVVEHYGLDPNCAWFILRSSYPWATKQKPKLRNLSVTMIQDKVSIPGPHFQITTPGETVNFSYGGQDYTLTLQEYEAQTMDLSHMPYKVLESPNHYVVMSYTIAPELPDGVLGITDCDEGDRAQVACFGVVHSAVACGEEEEVKIHAACSSMYFEPVEQVEWLMVFHEKQIADVTVDLFP